MPLDETELFSGPRDATAPIFYDPASPLVVRAVLQEIGAAPNRTLGQNFLIAPVILERIVAIAGVSASDTVLEIGPGPGGLTCRLARDAGQVVAIEKDPNFVGILARHLPANNLRVLAGDALRLSWDGLGLPEQNVKVVANLPYFISKPMLRRFLEEWRPHFSALTILVQREVADRIVAAPGTSAYGPMAIMSRLYTEAKRVFDVKPGSFLPAPKVTSSVVHLKIRESPFLQLCDENLFWRLVTAAFGQRRKQLGNTLRAVAPREIVDEMLRANNIEGQRRGETLSLEEFAALTDWLADSDFQKAPASTRTDFENQQTS